MRRKAMMRILALAAAVMMTVTGIPTTAFTASAAEADPAVEYAAEDAGEADEEEEVLPEDGADGADDAGGQEETPDAADGGEEGNGEEEGAGGEPDAAAAEEGGAENPEADGAGSGDDASDDSGSGNDGGQPEGQSGGDADASENGADTGNNPDQSTDPSASEKVTGSDNADKIPAGQELTEEERLEKEEADRLEKERIEKEEAERLEQERLEKERLEKELAEKEEEEVKMPGVTLNGNTRDLQVRAVIDEGIFPEGVFMRLKGFDADEAMEIAQELLGEEKEVVDAMAVDITFLVLVDGEAVEVQPTDPAGVHVELTPRKREIEGEAHEVIHIDDDDNAETVEANVDGEGASFDSVGFSVYAIVGYDGTQSGDVPRNLYKFYTEKADGTFELWDEQILKDGETLVEPGIPDGPNEHCAFVGWFEGPDHEQGGGEAQLEFDTPVSITGTTDTILEYHAHFERDYLVIFYNAAGVDVIDEKEFEWDPATNSASNPVTVSLSGPKPQLGAGEKFLGWIAKDADPTSMTEATYPVDGTISITSADNVELKALVKDAYKITFEANAGDDIATFTEPIMVLPGQTATQPTNPTRDGYTFTGWYTNAAATNAFNWSSPINQNYTLYAGWQARNDTPYTIYIWREIMVDGNPNNTHYELVLEQTDTATTGSTVNWNTQKRSAFESSSAATSARSDNSAFDYRYYEFDTSKNTPTVIKGDGSTIINAYYNLRTFTLEFNLNRNNRDTYMTVNGTTYYGNGTRYTMSVKLGQNIAATWPTSATRPNRTFGGWNSPFTSPGNQPVLVTKRHFVEKEMLSTTAGVPRTDQNIVYTANWLQGQTTSYTINYYFEKLTSTDISQTSNYEYSEDFSQTLQYSSGQSWNAKQIDGYTFNDNISGRVGTTNVWNYYYYRNRHSIIYHNWGETGTDNLVRDNILYGTDISTAQYYYNPTASAAGLPDYYEFQGWYTSRNYSDETKYAFSTMPDENVTLYAYWKAKDITISFDTGSGGSAVPSQTITAGGYAQEPAEEPTREGFVFAGWEINGYPINFENHVFTEDDVVTAVWATTEEYGVLYTTDKAEDKDKMPSSVGGKFRFNSSFVVQGIQNETEVEHFLGWEILGAPNYYTKGSMFRIDDLAYVQATYTYDGTTYENVVVLKAYYGDPEPLPVQLMYHSNYPDGTAEATHLVHELNDPTVLNGEFETDGDGVLQNRALEAWDGTAAQTLDGVSFSVAGYRLIGWNSDPTAAAAGTVEFAIGRNIAVDQLGADDVVQSGSTVAYRDHLYGVWEPDEVKYTVWHNFQKEPGSTEYVRYNVTNEQVDPMTTKPCPSHEYKALSGTTVSIDDLTDFDLDGFVGYELNDDRSDWSETVAADGSTELNAYFDLVDYTLTYRFTGTYDSTKVTPPAASTHPYTERVDVDTTYVAGNTYHGYKFLGYSTTHDDLSIKNDGADYIIMPHRDAELVGTWEADDTDYRVIVYLQNEDATGYDEQTPYTTKSAKTGTQVTETMDAPEGFTYNSTLSEPTGIVKYGETPDDRLTLKLYFDRKSYTVKYRYTNYTSLTRGGGAADPTETELNEITETYLFGAHVAPTVPVTISPNPSDGYSFSGFTTNRFGTEFDITEDIEGDIIYYGTFEHANHEQYIVEHYWRDVDAANNTLLNTYTLAKKTDNSDDWMYHEGAAGAEASYVQHSYSGYTFVPGDTKYFRRDVATPENRDDDTETTDTNIVAAASGKILVIKLYYEPVKRDVVYTYTDHASGESDLPTTVQYYYGATVTIAPDATAPGYTFSGWQATPAGGATPAFNPGDTSFTMPARNVNISGSWTANTGSYTLTHYYQQSLEAPDDETYSTTYYDESGTASACPGHTTSGITSGTKVTLTWDEQEGYTKNETHPNNVITGTVYFNDDGTVYYILDDSGNPIMQSGIGAFATEFRMYYDLTPLDITYTYVGEKPAGIDPASDYNVIDGAWVGKVTDVYNNGVKATYAKNAEVNGYKFKGWHTKHIEGVELVGNNLTQPARDVELQGEWEAIDVDYVVEHYQQGKDGSYPDSPTESETKQGKTDTQAQYSNKTYSGFRYVGDKTEFVSRTATGETAVADATILGDGTLVIKLYYDRNKYNITYQYTGTVPDTAYPSRADLVDYNKTGQLFGSAQTVAADAVAPGYTFSGWTATDAAGTEIATTGEDFTMPAGNVTVRGSFAPNDVEYVIKYFKQDPNDPDIYTEETSLEKTKTGKTDGDATYDDCIKEITGYTFNDEKTEYEVDPAGKITVDSDGEGNQVIKLYYDCKTYNVFYSYTNQPTTTPNPLDPSLKNMSGVRFGQTVTVTPDAVAPGHDFSGWTATDPEGATLEMVSGGDSATTTDGTKSGDEYGAARTFTFTMPDGNVSVKGSWTPGETTYKVRWYYLMDKGDMAGEYPLVPDPNKEETRKATTGDLVRTTEDDRTPETPPETPTTAGCYADQDSYFYDVTAGEQFSEATLRGDGSTILRVYFNLQYTVKFTDGTGNEGIFDDELYEKGTETGLDYGDDTPAPKANTARKGYEFKGWQTDADIETEDGTTYAAGDILPPDTDFPSQIKVKKDTTYTAIWEPIKYTITYDLDGGTVADGANPTEYTVESDDITLVEPTKTGYVFNGWTGTDLDGETKGVTIKKGSTGNREYKAHWTPAGDTPYTVNHHLQDPGKTTYTLKETENLKGVTDSEVTPAVKQYDGYESPKPQTVTIAPDGSTVVDYYYNLKTYTVTYEDGVDGSAFETQTYKDVQHGSETPAFEGKDGATEPERPGYVFNGWRDGEGNVGDVAETVTGDVTYTATWKPCNPVNSDDAEDEDGNPVEHDPPVKKIVTGDKPPKKETFRFTLKAVGNTAGLDENPMPSGSNGQQKQVSVQAGEEYEFGIITFTMPGKYSYEVTEENTHIPGYTYDTSKYRITYDVWQDGEDLRATRIMEKNGKNVNVAVFEFTNPYHEPEDGDDDNEPDKPAPGPHYTVHVAGIKTWVDDGYKSGNRPQAITIRLYADGKEVAQRVLSLATAGTTNADIWTFDFGEMDMYDAGVPITYTLIEDATDGYKSTVTSEYKKVEDVTGSTLIFSLVNTADSHVNRRAARATGDENATIIWGLIVAAGMVLMGVWFAVMNKRRRDERG